MDGNVRRCSNPVFSCSVPASQPRCFDLIQSPHFFPQRMFSRLCWDTYVYAFIFHGPSLGWPIPQLVGLPWRVGGAWTQRFSVARFGGGGWAQPILSFLMIAFSLPFTYTIILIRDICILLIQVFLNLNSSGGGGLRPRPPPRPGTAQTSSWPPGWGTRSPTSSTACAPAWASRPRRSFVRRAGPTGQRLRVTWTAGVRGVV